MSPYRAVLFDFFGTLTTAVARGPWHASIARRLGCDPGAFTEVLDRSFRARARGAFGTAEATLRWVCDQLGADPSREALRVALRARVAAIRADTWLRPDALATLAGVRARGLRTAVVSDCGHELPAFLPRLPVARLLDAHVYSVDVGECKPHPAMYDAACQRLGVAPGECLYIGDGGGQELTGALVAGMDAVRLAAPDLREHLVFRPDQDFTGPSVPSLTDAIRYLDACERNHRLGVEPVPVPAARHAGGGATRAGRTHPVTGTSRGVAVPARTGTAAAVPSPP